MYVFTGMMCFTRDTHKQDVCLRASLCGLAHVTSGVCALSCQAPPLPQYSIFFPFVNSVTPSSGPWHYRKTGQGKEQEHEQEGGWIEGNRGLRGGTFPAKRSVEVVTAKGKILKTGLGAWRNDWSRTSGTGSERWVRDMWVISSKSWGNMGAAATSGEDAVKQTWWPTRLMRAKSPLERKSSIIQRKVEKREKENRRWQNQTWWWTGI